MRKLALQKQTYQALNPSHSAVGCMYEACFELELPDGYPPELAIARIRTDQRALYDRVIIS